MSKDFLYSPWRLDYIQQEKPGDCIFCHARDSGDDAGDLIVHRSQHCFVMLNRYPYNNGHILIVPNEHQASLNDLPEVVLADLARLTRLSEKVLYEVYRCDGINAGLNLGRSAGAGIEGHLHVHMVPRWSGDSNFMSIVSGIRVIPEAFNLARQRLREGYQRELGGGV